MPDIEEIGKYIKTNNYYVILNLESPLNASGKPINKGGPNLHSDEKAIVALRQLNVIAVCLANNHMMDFGSEALEKTIDILDKAGIPHVGAGMNLGEALRPVIIECEGQKIVLQNFAWKYEEAVYATKTTAGVAPRDDVTVKRSTIENKNKYQDSILVTVMYWGFENNTLPMPYDIQLAHECIDNGSDLVIGSHPHVTQPFEKYKGKYIFYSLGNFTLQREEKDINVNFQMKCLLT